MFIVCVSKNFFKPFHTGYDSEMNMKIAFVGIVCFKLFLIDFQLVSEDSIYIL